MFSNFKERLERELLALRPFQSKFQVSIAQNPVLDSWYGARRWALQSDLEKFSVTRADYEEYGGEYLKEHMTSNQYFPTPAGGSGNCSETSSRRSETPGEITTQGGAGAQMETST